MAELSGRIDRLENGYIRHQWTAVHHVSGTIEYPEGPLPEGAFLVGESWWPDGTKVSTYQQASVLRAPVSTPYYHKKELDGTEIIVDKGSIQINSPDGKPAIRMGVYDDGPSPNVYDIDRDVYARNQAAYEEAKRVEMEAMAQKWKFDEAAAGITGPLKAKDDWLKNAVSPIGAFMNPIAPASEETITSGLKGLISQIKNLRESGTCPDLNIYELLDEIMTEETKTEEQIALEGIAQSLTEHWSSQDWLLQTETFMLNSPLSLTILREKGYGKKGHIGGEEFEPLSAYVGRKGALIVVFKPNSMEEYSKMEMTMSDCNQYLTGFQPHMTELGIFTRLAEVREKKEEALREARLKEHGEKYEEFGSW